MTKILAKISNDIDNGQSLLIKHCNNLKKKVVSSAEQTIKQINEQSDYFLNQIENYKVKELIKTILSCTEVEVPVWEGCKKHAVVGNQGAGLDLAQGSSAAAGNQRAAAGAHGSAAAENPGPAGGGNQGAAVGNH